MALTNPRIYDWRVSQSPPFIANETRMYVTDSLRAGDDHAIPFPRRLRHSEVYRRADQIRVQLMIQTDDQPFPGVSYVMWIDVNRNPSTWERVGAWIEDQIPDPLEPEALGPVGGAVYGQMEDPTDSIGGERIWNARVRLIDVDSVEQAAGGGTQVRGRVRTVTVRYEVMTPGEDDSEPI